MQVYQIVHSTHFGWMLIESDTKRIIKRNNSKDKLVKYCETLSKSGRIELTVLDENNGIVETYKFGKE